MTSTIDNLLERIKPSSRRRKHISECRNRQINFDRQCAYKIYTTKGCAYTRYTIKGCSRLNAARNGLVGKCFKDEAGLG